ncbi:helix-turn-helix transcriptional regulator [Roseospira goensis]|uniref:DNA-binding CsgD family transcriptional regulator n=1 Tax=Roseospira goensis TaxID=391922 RepID=A0A7W6S2H5_9PROT|nr:DNA-binding CsgD family transcriptional regulator [Roseospira goensis]
MPDAACSQVCDQIEPSGTARLDRLGWGVAEAPFRSTALQVLERVGREGWTPVVVEGTDGLLLFGRGRAAAGPDAVLACHLIWGTTATVVGVRLDRRNRPLSDRGGPPIRAVLPSIRLCLTCPEGPWPLPERQRQCLALLAAGLRTGEIAARLGISASAVEHHVRAARGRFAARTRAAAVVAALRQGALRSGGVFETVERLRRVSYLDAPQPGETDPEEPTA